LAETLIYSVSYFNLGGLGPHSGGLSLPVAMGLLQGLCKGY